MTPLLVRSLTVQNQARSLIALRDAGRTETADFQRRMLDWVEERRKLFTSPLDTPLDGLIIAHGALQCATAIPHCIDTDDVASLRVAITELITAATNLISYFEVASGTTRDALGLHDDYTGPARN